jgi:acetyl-CoA carboxylase biotin carboxyl carrier protein
MDVFNKIKDLVEMMNDSDLIEIEIKDGEREIKLRKGGSAPEREYIAMSQVSPMNLAGAPLNHPPQQGGGQETAGAPSSAEKDPNLSEFNSPMVGTFYRAPSPESPPYVTEGDRINKDSVLCIIEAMKVMNEIKAESGGEIVEILVENGEAVEFGQPLFSIRTAS